MQRNKALDSTSSKNSVSDTSKFQSFPISFYNVDNKDKSLPFLLSATSKAFHCKETGVQVNTDNSQNNKSNSCEKRDSVVFTKPSSDILSNFFVESILKGKRDISTYKQFVFQITTDAEKYEMIQNVFISDKSFVFPATQYLLLHRWFKLFPRLCYSLVEDGAYCLLCLLFAGKKNTATKSFIFKLFKHWPDGMGAFKRHINPEPGVHNKCMFYYDQLISRLKGKNVSIDVSVNSLSNAKVLNNRKIILAIIDAMKLYGRLVIALRGHIDASKYHSEIGHAPISAGVGNFVPSINCAIRNGNKVLENYLKPCSKREAYLTATSQNDLLKCCYEVITEGLLKEVKASKIFALILDEASDISSKEQLSFCLGFV